MRDHIGLNGLLFHKIHEYPSYFISSCGNVYSTKRNRLLKPGNSNGYPHVMLSENKLTKCIVVHRLVALAFIPNPFNLPTINHKDGDKGNNDVSNLEWCTYKHNMQHAFATGLMPEIRNRKGRTFKNPDSTRQKMSEQKRGKLHPKFKGFYHTPFGVFETAAESGMAENKCRTSMNRKFHSEKHPDYYRIPIPLDA